MLSFKSIKKAFNTILSKETGYKIYGKEVSEGYDTPSLFIEIVSKPTNRETPGYAKSGFTIKITFFQDTPNEVEQLELLDTVRDSIGMTVEIENRILTVGDFSFDYVGQKEDILQISIDFDFYENTTTADTEDIAEEMNFNINQQEVKK